MLWKAAAIVAAFQSRNHLFFMRGLLRSVPFIIENIRLKELAIIAEQNRAMFDDFILFLSSKGFLSLHAFVCEVDDHRAQMTIVEYFARPLPQGLSLFDGLARPYNADKSKWLLLGWLFRDAPEQRLRPMLNSVPGDTPNERRAHLFNTIRKHLATIFPGPERWDWSPICEVFIDRLEGSRRAIKGTLFETIVRRNLIALFEHHGINLSVSETEVRISGETYDLKVSGRGGEILIPVKTRETMGGGHANLFTRDIHKAISVAREIGVKCIPIIIAESWGGDLQSLGCENFIWINKNPNQILEVEPVLVEQLAKCIDAFKVIL